MEEELIEEEEADLASYVEDLEEDAAFEELEEETRSAEEYREPVAREIAASGERRHQAVGEQWPPNRLSLKAASTSLFLAK